MLKATTGGLVVVLLSIGGNLAAEKKPAPARKQIVARITKVGVNITKTEKDPTPALEVSVTGQVNTGGYKNVQLVRVVYDKPPQDGIQDYVLFAEPPSGGALQVISKVTASNRWKAYGKSAPWLKGIRIHGVGKGIKLEQRFPLP